MKVLVLGGSNSRNSGGIFNSAKELGIHLNSFNDVEISFLLHSDEYSNEDIKTYAPLKVFDYVVKGFSGLGYSSDLSSVLKSVNPDIVHTQTLWMYLSKANLENHHKYGTPYVISPRGMLDSWQLRQSLFKDLKKKIALSLYEREHLERASSICALCYEEYIAIREFGLKNPVAIIPNGVRIPESYLDERDLYVTHSRGRKRLLFLSRIHRKKGLENLLRAWSYVKSFSGNWILTIAGETKDLNYLKFLHNLVIDLDISNSVEFVGGKFGQNKREMFIMSDAFILPSYSEGLPMAVLEAWSYRLPTLITPFCNLQEGFRFGASIEIDTDIESIAIGIKKMFDLSQSEMDLMAQNGYDLVESKFTWDVVARNTKELYSWILYGGNVPEFVKLD